MKDNSWHHLVISRNGDDIFDTILVIDGEHITTDRYADSTDSWGITEPFDTRIGTRTTAPHHQTFNGWIDELAIWSGRQLSVEEAIGLWRAATGQGTVGDYNANGVVDAADYVVWRDALGTSAMLPNDPTSGTVTQEDYLVWRRILRRQWRRGDCFCCVNSRTGGFTSRRGRGCRRIDARA